MRRPRVLIVDDDRDICEFVAWGLSDRGYTVVSAENGRKALDSVTTIRPDAIVLDMRMPVMNGWEFAEVYRELPGPHAPIIIMTAYLDSAAVAAEVGAQGHISKPFNLVRLADILRPFVSE
jgi:two-component system, chemotaxis family, chemotaxis protein CheY